MPRSRIQTDMTAVSSGDLFSKTQKGELDKLYYDQPRCLHPKVQKDVIIITYM